MTIQDCSHRPPCPGCPRYGDDSLPGAALAVLGDLALRAGTGEPECVVARSLGSRHRARLMVRGRARSPKVGIFEAGSHRIVDIPNCGIHHPLINEVAGALKSAIYACDLRPYVDQSHQGLVRAVQVVVDDADPEVGAQAQVVVVTNDRSSDAAKPLLELLCAELGTRLHSLHWNGQPEPNNTIIGPYWRCVEGPEALERRVGSVRVFYPPGAFGQANTLVAPQLVERLHAWIPGAARVAEFYAGVGAIGLGLVERAAMVRLNEIGEHSLLGLRAGLDAMPEQLRTKTEVYPGNAAACTGMLEGCDTAIVDPPRRGLDRGLREALGGWAGARIVYVSCGVESYAADADALLDDGWRLAEQIAYGFFPFTEHIETLARFERA